MLTSYHCISVYRTLQPGICLNNVVDTKGMQGDAFPLLRGMQGDATPLPKEDAERSTLLSQPVPTELLSCRNNVCWKEFSVANLPFGCHFRTLRAPPPKKQGSVLMQWLLIILLEWIGIYSMPFYTPAITAAPDKLLHAL